MRLKIATVSVLMMSKAVFGQYLITNSVEDAIKNSNLIKHYEYKIKETQHSNKEVELSRYGMIRLNSIYTKGDDPVYVFASKMRQHEFSMADMMSINNPDPVKNFEISIEGGIPIFTGYKIENYDKITKTAIDANRKIYEEVKTAISFKASYSYLTLLLFKKLKDFSLKAISSSEIELESAKKLNEKGMIFGSDYYAALSIYEMIKNYDWQWKNSLLAQIKELSVLTGKNISEEDIKSELRFFEIPLDDEESYIKTALKNKNELKAYEDFIKISEIQKEINKNSILPEIVGFVSFAGNTRSISDLKTAYIYGIKMSIPFGDPTYYEKIKKANVIIKENEELKKSKEMDLIEEIKKTYSEIVSARKSIDITFKSIENAEKSLELFKPLYHQGKQSIMEVLRAEANLLEARAKHYEAVYKYILMNIKLRYLTGTLDEDFLNKISKNL